MPYTVYTTGIGWRNDQVPADIGALSNPYDVAVGSEVQGQDGRHRRLAHRDGAWCCCKQRQDRRQHDFGRRPQDWSATSSTALVAATSPKVTITMYSDLPAGQLGLCQMWSGDVINAR